MVSEFAAGKLLFGVWSVWKLALGACSGECSFFIQTHKYDVWLGGKSPPIGYKKTPEHS